MSLSWVARLVVVLVFIACGLVGWGTPAGDAYLIKGKRWPGETITYYNRAVDQQWAVTKAVRAWNASGARIRFRPATERNADIIITHLAHSDCAGHTVKLGQATVGFSRHGVVYVVSLDEQSLSCNRFAVATIVAHELGHVLGLGHDNRGCAVMNSVATLFGPDKCARRGFEWPCRLLTADDTRGAVRLYGGTPRAPAEPRLCPFYKRIVWPSTLFARYRPAQSGVELSFTRPREPVLPAFFARLTKDDPPGLVRGGYAFTHTADRCPTQADYSGARRLHWSTAVGVRTTIIDRSPPAGRYCYAVWAIDKANLPSARPITAYVSVP